MCENSIYFSAPHFRLVPPIHLALATALVIQLLGIAYYTKCVSKVLAGKAHLTHFLMSAKIYLSVLDETLHGSSLDPQ